MAGQRGRTSVVLFGMLVGLLILATIAVSAGALIVLSDRLPSTTSQYSSALPAINANAITPTLALGALAGVSDQEVIDHALAANSSDTALVALLYSTTLSDQARTGSLLALAGLLAREDENERALLIARTAADVAILSPLMSDYSRATALNQAGQLMATLGRKEDAVRTYSSAAVIAAQSGSLDAAYRRMLLDGLAGDLGRAGRADLATTLRTQTGDLPPTALSSAVLPAMLVPLAAADTADVQLLETLAARRSEAAAGLIASLQGQSAVPAVTSRRKLADALIDEDPLRQRVYSDGIAHSSDLLQRVAAAREYMRWLTLKWRIAQRGFGMTIVPTWEDQSGSIQADLDAATHDYYLLLRDVAISLPTGDEAVQGAAEIIQDQIKVGRLGLPAGSQEALLLQDLAKAQQNTTLLGIASRSVVKLETAESASWLAVIKPLPATAP